LHVLYEVRVEIETKSLLDDVEKELTFVDGQINAEYETCYGVTVATK
jgi:hypothetical protein